jgi:hypothetical protein
MDYVFYSCVLLIIASSMTDTTLKATLPTTQSCFCYAPKQSSMADSVKKLSTMKSKRLTAAGKKGVASGKRASITSAAAALIATT